MNEKYDCGPRAAPTYGVWYHAPSGIPERMATGMAYNTAHWFARKRSEGLPAFPYSVRPDGPEAVYPTYQAGQRVNS